MASITSWTRIEPRARHDDIEIGLQARVYDPAWMLGRQLQLGELNGSWGGSPVIATVATEAAPVSRFHPGSLSSAQAGIEAVQKRALELGRMHGGGGGPTVADWLQAQSDRGGLLAGIEAASTDYSPAALALEVLTEAEPITLGRGSSTRMAIDTGQQFLRFLEDKEAGQLNLACLQA